jgi:hypothetical protein
MGVVVAEIYIDVGVLFIKSEAKDCFENTRSLPICIQELAYRSFF